MKKSAKRKFYETQAESFRDYANKYPDGNLLSIFNEWAESKDVCGVDRHEIWKIARKLRPPKTIVIKENSEEFVRISAVLDILLQADLAYLNELIEKKKSMEKTGEKNKLDKT